MALLMMTAQDHKSVIAGNAHTEMAAKARMETSQVRVPQHSFCRVPTGSMLTKVKQDERKVCFMDLPLELRTKIYKLLLIYRGKFIVIQYDQRKLSTGRDLMDRTRHEGVKAAILGANKEIRSEAAPIL